MLLQFIQSTSTFTCQMLEIKRVLPILSAISWFCSLFSTSLSATYTNQILLHTGNFSILPSDPHPTSDLLCISPF